MSTTVLTGPRWSSAVRCPRRAVYEGLDVEREPESEELQGYLRRGRILGRLRAIEFDEALEAAGRPRGIAELEVPWPFADPVGTGHADYFVPDVTTIVEVVSSENCELPPHKALQGVGYALNYPAATAAMVVAIDPSSLAERAYPLNLEGLAETVREIEETVVRGIRDGEIPDRPDGIESPTQGLCFGCPFKRTCWKHWEPLPVGTLPVSVHDDLRRLAELEDDCARFKNVPHLESERQEIRDKLEGMMAEGGVYRGGGVQVKWSGVEGRRTFRLADYIKAGHELPPVAESFISNGKGHRRWTVRRLEEGQA